MRFLPELFRFLLEAASAIGFNRQQENKHTSIAVPGKVICCKVLAKASLACFLMLQPTKGNPSFSAQRLVAGPFIKHGDDYALDN
jgi:hypothetical protein